MKKLLLLLLLLSSLGGVVRAQLPNGVIAPDFTITGVVDGNNHNLYSKLDENKTVFLDFFATWCGPCWSYHNSGALEGIWESYGPPGTDEAYVMGIEGDAATNVACIFGPSGCNNSTLGDWTAGVGYPIGDDAALPSAYNINFYPTIYCVCPWDKKVYQCGQLPTGALWNYRNTHCTTPPMAITVVNQQNNTCFGQLNSEIDIEVAGGVPPFTYLWTNGATTEDLQNVPAGNYSCTVTSSQNAGTKKVGPLNITAPSSSIAVNFPSVVPLGCTNPGSISVSASGGYQNFTFDWSNGDGGETIEILTPGTYTVTATDAEGCTKTKSQLMAAAQYPLAQVATPAQLTCTNNLTTLNGSNSTSGDDIIYNWVVGTGGNIVSGQGTSTAVVNAAAIYVLQVTNTVTNCTATKTVAVTADQSLPAAEAGPVGTLTCSNPSTTLQGTGSSGTNFSYLWTTNSGGNIVSGGNSLTPSVNGVGNYILKVTNLDNGCAKFDTTSVAGNTTPPTVSVAAATLTCANPAAPLNTTTNASNPTFAWSGPNGFTSTVQNPSVSSTGNYTVVVTDQTTGCTQTQSATASANTNPPGASAIGGTVTCATTSVNLNGNSPVSNVSYAWTGPNNFTSNLQNPVSGTAGTYNLVVTWADNGCTSSTAATVFSNTNPPTAAIATPSNLNCNTNSVQMNGANSSQGANFSYLWTTSNGNIVSGENTLTPIVNSAGTYVLQVTNADNGCTANSNSTVVQTPAVTAAVGTQTNVSCNGNANGSATAIAGGGNGTYSFSWSNGQNGANLTNVLAGNYVVAITDGENCTATSSVTISQPAVLNCNASATAQTANGQNDGTATANPNGGTANYSYIWSNGQTTQTISGLAPGSFTVSVSDANGCVDIQTVTVNSVNCALVANVSSTNVSCFGLENGSATANLAGAASPVTYNWSNGGTTANISNLAAGNYSVQILDGNGCPAELSVNISQPAQLQANAIATPETAPGANNGTASATPTGGTGNYTYSWSNGATTSSISNLAPGSYSVEILDGNGCGFTQTVIVASASCAMSAAVSAVNVSCAGNTNGQATVSLTGGNAPFIYNWSNGQTAATATNLAPGNYSVSVSDAVGCEAVQTTSIAEPLPIAFDLLAHSHVVCPTDANGMATVAANGGTGNFSYLWSNGQTGATVNNLTVGVHSVLATDENGCTHEMWVNIMAVDEVAPVISLQNATVGISQSGTATVTLADLQAVLTDNCAVSASEITPNQFTCAQIGQQTVTVTVWDAAGNSSSASANVNIVDNLAPQVSCPADIQKCYSEATVNYAAPTAEDNCTGQGQWNLVEGLASGSTFPVGKTVNIYTYTDAAGNVGQCQFQVEIVSQTAVSAVISGGCFQTCEGFVSLENVTGGISPYFVEWSNGQTGMNATGVCADGITVSILDGAGCRTAQTLNLNIPSALAMAVNSIQNATNGQSNGSVKVTVSGGATPYLYVWTDALGNFVSNQEDLENVPAGTYNLAVTDANGCNIKNVEGIIIENVVNTNEPNWAKGMKIVPNPTQGFVQIRFSEMPKSDVELMVLDATGRNLMNLISTGEQIIELDLTGLPDAIYTVRLRSAGEVSMRKLVLNR